MIESSPPLRNRELGDFVRAMRERLRPEDIGLPMTARRRTPGLRREEVAQRCGISATWYTWLEQGREMQVSAGALARLADALQLDRAGRAYLFELAERRDPRQPIRNEPLPTAAAACVHAIAAPAYVLDREWTARSWNAAAAHLFAGWLDGDADRNLLRFVFLAPAARALIADFDSRARRVIAEFRADVGARLEEPGIRTLVEDLAERSAIFARLWNEHSVLDRHGGPRAFSHPRDGMLAYEQITFALVDDRGFKLTILMPQ